MHFVRAQPRSRAPRTLFQLPGGLQACACGQSQARLSQAGCAFCLRATRRSGAVGQVLALSHAQLAAPSIVVPFQAGAAQHRC